MVYPLSLLGVDSWSSVGVIKDLKNLWQKGWVCLFPEYNALHVKMTKLYLYLNENTVLKCKDSNHFESIFCMIYDTQCRGKAQNSRKCLVLASLSLETTIVQFTLGCKQHFEWKNDLHVSYTQYRSYVDCVGLLQYFYLHVSWDKNVLWFIKPWPEEHWCIGCVHYTFNGTVYKPKQGKYTHFCKNDPFCILPTQLEVLL